MIVYAVYDVKNQFLCAFGTNDRAQSYLKGMATCRQGYVMKMEMRETGE